MIMARPRARFATFSASAGGRSLRAITCAGRKTMISRQASRRIRRIRLGHRDRCGSYLLSGAFREFVNRYEKQVRCLEPILGPGGLMLRNSQPGGSIRADSVSISSGPWTEEGSTAGPSYSIVILQSQVRNHFLPAEIPQGVLQLHELNKEVVLRIDFRSAHGTLEVKR